MTIGGRIQLGPDDKGRTTVLWDVGAISTQCVWFRGGDCTCGHTEGQHVNSGAVSRQATRCASWHCQCRQYPDDAA